jgi:large conductance mechanosensitive channel
MIKEFREFILRGNVIDLAVAVVIGVAFSAIITSLVNDILMPLIGIVVGGVDFSGLAVQVGSAVIAYGKFLQAVVNFLLIGFTLFLIIKSINSMQERFSRGKAVQPEPAAPPEDIQLLREIRDLLKQERAQTD